MKIRILILTVLFFAALFSSFAQSYPTFTDYTIDDSFAGTSTAFVIDIDKDGLKDVVCGSEYTPSSISQGVAWWKNNGDNSWTKHIISTGADNIMSVEIVEINDDGYWDVLTSGWTSHEIAYWTSDDSTPPIWTKNTVASNYYNAHDAHAGHINADGLVDIVGVSDYLGQISVWFQQENGSWSQQIIENNFNGGKGLAISDFNGDGRNDVVGVSADLGTIAIYYNEGGSPVVWTKQTVENAIPGAHEVFACDIDQDGDKDLLTSAYTSGRLDIWLNDGENPVNWTNIPVGMLESAVRAVPADIDEDGYYDIVATAKFPGELSVWYNDGNFSFTKEVIDNSMDAVWAVFAADIDNDNHNDIVSGSAGDGLIKWWCNDLTTNIDDPGKADKIRISPNPANNSLMIEGLEEPCVVSIFNSIGEIVLTESIRDQIPPSAIFLDINDHANGTYILRITGETTTISKKIIVNHHR
nr:T9SS type A sorting domain-containing protein [Bacteroidota bacterium]